MVAALKTLPKKTNANKTMNHCSIIEILSSVFEDFSFIADLFY